MVGLKRSLVAGGLLAFAAWNAWAQADRASVNEANVNDASVNEASALAIDDDGNGKHALQPPAEIQGFLDSFCIECHSGPDPEGDLSLPDLPFALADHGVRKRWELLLDYVQDEDMPPEEADRFPTADERLALLEALRHAMAEADRDQPVTPAPLRRLNRNELLNTATDLFGIRGLRLPTSLPDDQSDLPFDTMAEGLTLSTAFLDGVLEFATDIADRMVPSPAVQTTYVMTASQWDLGKMGWRLDGGGYKFTGVNVAGWGGAVRDHNFRAPASGVYRVDLRVRAEAAKGIDGRPLRLGFYALVPSEYEFPERALRAGLPRVGAAEVSSPEYIDVTCEIELEAGESFHLYCENRLPEIDATGGRNRIQLGALVNAAKLRTEPTVHIQGMRVSGPVAPLARQKAFYGADAPPTDAAGLSAILLPLAERAYRRPLSVDEQSELIEQVLAHGADAPEPGMALHYGLRRIVCSAAFLHLGAAAPEGVEMSSDTLSSDWADEFALANRLSYFFWSSMPDAELFELAARGLLSQSEVLHAQVDRMLADPKAERLIADFTGQWLGNRRMQALMVCNVRYPWSELLRDGYIRSTESFFREILQRNLSVRTMIDSDFTYGNLYTQEVWGIPGDYPNLAYMEAHQIQAQVWPDVQRIDLTSLPPGTPPAVQERGGLLGLPGVLAATGDGVESSPILRGVWILDNLLGDPPPPPPANVPALVADTTGSSTVRELLIAHQASTSCAKCHSKIDPLGFAMENYDAIGNWRDEYPPLVDLTPVQAPAQDEETPTQEEPTEPSELDKSVAPHSQAPATTDEHGHTKIDAAAQGLPIDTESALPDGTPLAGVRDIKDYLLARPEVFTACLAGKLLEYSLGRELLPADRRLVAEIVAAEPQAGYGLRDLIHALVESEAFGLHE